MNSEHQQLESWLVEVKRRCLILPKNPNFDKLLAYLHSKGYSVDQAVEWLRDGCNLKVAA